MECGGYVLVRTMGRIFIVTDGVLWKLLSVFLIEQGTVFREASGFYSKTNRILARAEWRSR